MGRDGEAKSVAEMTAQARALLAFGCGAVLVKGGHAAGGDTAVDVLATADGGLERIEAPWVATENTHGTGCTLSAAIAAHLAHGLGLVEAVRAAKTYLSAALAAGKDQRIGHGHGPVDHLFNVGA